MLKKLYPLLLAGILALQGLHAHAQTPAEAVPARTRAFCGFDEQQEAYFAAHPGARLVYKALNAQLAAAAADPAQQRSILATPNVTVPVVVHVIHSGGTNNVSDAQIFSALAQLNQDYQKLNPDTANTLPVFQPIAANIGFQFKLAKLDPDGNCTTGITRSYAPALINDDRAGTVKNFIRWDTNRYLNIWLVSTIGTVQANGGIILGYAQFPGQSPATDGLVIRNDYFGDRGTSNPNRARERTVTHEIGHYFGLLHPWGNGAVETAGNCSDTDYVDDTPPTNGTFTCKLDYAPCGVLANVQNYMDYASCATMFTEGQKARMRSALQSLRPGLTSPTNLAATGTTDAYAAAECAPKAAFAAITTPSVCVNSPVILRDYSYNYTANGGPLTYSWSLPGGNPSTANTPTVTVSYPTAGFYTVTETVTNSVGGSTYTVQNLIRVEGPTGGLQAPFAESFEDPNFPNLFAAPSLRNYDVSGASSTGVPAPYRWLRQMAYPAADGAAYLFVNNRSNPAGAVATLITPNIDLGRVAQPAVLSFARAFAVRSATSNVELRVAFSSDCGTTWSAPVVYNEAALSTKGTTPIDGYVPASSADWQTLTVPIPAQYQGSGVFKVRLQLVNGTTQGNNFFLDYLRVTAPLATATRASALASRGIAVYPNPLTNETAVHLTLPAATQVQVSLTDVLGRSVLTLPAKTYGAGPQTVALPTAGQALRAGVYVVRISLNGETFTSKLTVE